MRDAFQVTLDRLLMLISIFSIWLLATALPTSPLLASPTSYHECILEHMGGVSSDIAAQEIIAACQAKFPEATGLEEEPAKGSQWAIKQERRGPRDVLPPAALQKVKITIEVIRAPQPVARGWVENNNPDWHITQMRLGCKATFPGRVSRQRDYWLEIQVPPFTRVPFTISNVISHQEVFEKHHWQIKQLYGYSLH